MTYKSLIQHNAELITRLHQRVHETFAHRNDNEQSARRWEEATDAFLHQYGELAFPGGPHTSRERLRDGDQVAIEYALDFLEVRPYFFRSGYMYKDFIRVLRNCPLSEAQRRRYDRLHLRYQDFLRNQAPENENPP